MCVHPEPVSFAIIGQSGIKPSHLLHGVVAALRAPDSFPAALNAVLFESQWLYWLILTAVAAMAFYFGRSRADKRLTWAGVACAGLLVLWVAAAYGVDTPRERLFRAHQGLAEAARTADIGRIVSYLGPDFSSSVLGIEQAPEAREQIGERLKSYGVGASEIMAYRSDIMGRSAFTTLTLLTETATAGPVRTTWQLSWDDIRGADWRLRSAEMVRLGDEAIAPDRMLPK